MTSLLDLASARLGKRANLLLQAEHVIRLSLCAEPNKGPVTRVTGAGPTIEAAIDAAVNKLERGKA